jgi:predicted AlkP superfamily phosphohydrolase/phosphomutase
MTTAHKRSPAPRRGARGLRGHGAARTRALPFLAAGVLALAVLALAAGGCGRRAEAGAAAPRMIVLGFDGMDYGLASKLMAEGRMPNLARLAREGSFGPLETAVPPQSPVAWSNFITGMDAGGHGLFDFVHRVPETMQPYLSSSRVEAGKPRLKLGKYQLPGAGKVELLRHGEPFWEELERRGVPTTIVRIPANFPPSGLATRELSGMGTPDLVGTPGTFSFYTTELFAFYGKEISGGDVYEVFLEDGKVEAQLHGPDNPFLVEPTKVTEDFTVYVDPVDPVVKLALGDEERVLKVGEWTDWLPVEFKLVPTQKLRGMVRFYLKQVRPELELYATPLQIDPLDPALPISTPDDYATELAEATGRFYTQEMPEDTKALTGGIFDVDEFLAQAHMANQEAIKQYHYVLSQFREGLLFYYFGDSDQVSHMMWRSMDPGHPAYDAARDAPYSDVIPSLYETFDGVVGYTLEHRPPDTTVVVMSDHGFTSWRRAFHLNAWLAQNGYLAEIDPNLKNDPGFFANVDWSHTRAYGYGLNGLYINVAGREKNGIVDAAEKDALLDEIGAKLLATIDPATGTPAVTQVFRSDAYYQDRGYLDVGPDMIVGYAKGTRSSDDSALGSVGPDVITDNTKAWSGDHCMDPAAVPGILATSRPLRKRATSLKNLAAALLAEYGIEDFPPKPEPAG